MRDSVTDLARVGVIDVGSNSVRLVVFDGAARSPAYFYNEKVLCGLGKGLGKSGRLHPEGRKRALATLQRFATLARTMGCNPLRAVATAAVRDAEDGPDFERDVARETGIALEIISGVEEARFSGFGVLLGWPGAEGLVCDIGGSSMELARIGEGTVGASRTSPLGPLKLQDAADVEEEIAREVAILRKALPHPVTRLYLVGGSWRAIARIDMERRNYPLTVLHEYQTSPEAMIETADWIAKQDEASLSGISDTSSARLSLVPLAAKVLAATIRAFEPEQIAVSSYGLREGLLFASMPEELRRRDPLIEAARNMEGASSRFPGFGDALYDWIRPILGDASPERLRLVHGACLLHDVSWRAHPDYRAETCFESVTRANLGGLDHPARVFIGIALMNRYKGGSRSDRKELFDLLPAEDQREAATIGRAMRLGAMLTASSPGLLDQSSLCRQDGKLQLTLSGEARRLAGEQVEKRLGSLAQSMGLEADLLIGKDLPFMLRG